MSLSFGFSRHQSVCEKEMVDVVKLQLAVVGGVWQGNPWKQSLIDSFNAVCNIINIYIYIYIYTYDKQ